MKFLIGITLVFALMTGVACADYFYLTPTGTQEVELGDEVEVEVWWHTDEASVWVEYFDIAMSYDATELKFLDSLAFIPPIGLPFTPPAGAEDDEAGNLHFWKLFLEAKEITASETWMATLSFEVIAIDSEGGPDVTKLADVGGYGIVRWDPDFIGIYAAQYNAAAGANYIPEPTTTVLLGIGLAGMLLRKKK